MIYLLCSVGYLIISILMGLFLTYAYKKARPDLNIEEVSHKIGIGSLLWPFILLGFIVLLPATALAVALDKGYKEDEEGTE